MSAIFTYRYGRFIFVYEARGAGAGPIFFGDLRLLGRKRQLNAFVNALGGVM